MELFDGVSTQEQWLVQKATALNIPIGGTMELLPLCNMDCKMCYVRLSKAQMDAQGRLLNCDEWLRIARSAREAGVLFLLLTGGEPLMYPQFRELYMALSDMGFIITLNTNGTLIDDDWADFFAKRPCRRINITLYGEDDATYASLCGNAKGYTQVCHAVKLLRERKIPFRFNHTTTPHNAHQSQAMYEIAKSNGVPLVRTVYTFPPVREGKSCDTFERLSPDGCADALIEGAAAKNPGVELAQMARASLDQLKQPIHNHTAGFHCRAGRGGFWIDWHGNLMACGMITTDHASLLDRPFAQVWQEIAGRFRAMPVCEECETCKTRNVCPVCPAACHTETGSTSGRPDYLCRMTDRLIESLLQYLPEEERVEYRQLLSE